MTNDVTVKDFANSIGISEQRLIQHLKSAGIDIKASSDLISDTDKKALLSFLNAEKNSTTKSGIVLKRRTLGTVKLSNDVRKGKNISVEIRKKKVYQTIKPVENKLEPVEEKVLVKESSTVASDESINNPKEVKSIEENKKLSNAASEKPKERAAPSSEHKTTQKKTKKVDIRDKKEARFAKMERHITSTQLSNENKINKHAFEKPVAPTVKDIKIPESITVGDLAKKMSIKNSCVIKTMMGMGVMATINQFIDQETASLIVQEMGHNPLMLSDNALEEILNIDKNKYEQVNRPPVVTIMGHVDHGKTSLLDYIRRSKVAQKEAGGITQHIGAYHVATDRGVITFFDTPGHAAFSAMRARGASITDVVVLIVAADDGVKQQTVEAIQHAKSANVPIIVAINKIDKPEIDLERVKTELSKHDIISEEWGGDNIFINISAKSGQGVDSLLDAISLQADVLELKSADKGPARGTIIESRLDKGRGPISDILVQEGQLNTGDIVLSGMQYGKVRALVDEDGNKVKKVGPSIPVEVLGLSGICSVGDEIIFVGCEKKAREIATFRKSKFKDKKFSQQKRVSLDNLFDGATKEQAKKLNIVLKGDVQGSIEALVASISKFSSEEVSISFVASNVGSINESDVNLAVASNAIIIGFNVRADNTAKKIIGNEGISLKYYSVIYDVVDDIKGALKGMMNPKYEENTIGVAEVRDVFKTSKFGTIAGCMVIDGKIKRNHHIRLLRDNVVIHDGNLSSLRRFKDDASEVGQNYECGIGIQNYNDIKEKDKIEVYERLRIAPTLPE